MAEKTLYVGNLPYSISETALTSAFSSFGASNCRIIEGRGFGFVDVNADKVDEAISAMNGTTLEGRTITVNEARPREERPSRMGGYSASRGGNGFGNGRGASFSSSSRSRRW